MTQQLTVRIPDELSRSLRSAAARLQRNRSEIVRIALERFLEVEASRSRTGALRELIGSVHSGVSDLAERHREYVLESVRRGR